MRSLPILLLCAPLLCAGQHWAVKCGGPGNERVADVKTGPGDVLYSTGEFGPGSTVAGQGLVSQGLSDIFVLKQSAAGATQWIAQAGGAGLDLAGRVCAAPDGSVVVCGQFSGTANLFGTNVTAQGGSTDLFVAKLSGADGSALWVRTGGSAGYTDRAANVAVGADGRVVLTGEFRGDAVFDAGTFSSTIDPGTSAPGSDVFVASYTAAGAAEWFKQGVAVRDDQAADVIMDASGAAYGYGLYSEDISFGTPHPNAALNQIYLVKFDATGNELWFRRIGGAALQRPVDMQLGDGGGIHLCGEVQGTLSFFDTAPDAVPSTQPNAYFLLRAGTAGEFENGIAIGSANAIHVGGLTQRGATTSVYGDFTCAFTDLQDHYDATGIFIATGEEDLFIARHDAQTIALLEAQQFGGHLGKSPGGITDLNSGGLVFCGDFSELLIFPSEGDGWGEASNGCPPLAVGSPGYCGDPHYNSYEHMRSSGEQDGFIARGYVESREPYDAFLRSGLQCDRSLRDLDIYSQAEGFTDNVLVCGGDTLWWENTIHRPACPSCSCPPDSTISWAITDQWSTGQNYFDSTIVWNTGWVWRTHVSTNGCYDVTDSIYLTVLPEPHAWVSIDGGPPFEGGGLPNQLSYCQPVSLLAMDLLPGETFQWYVDGVPVADNPVLADESSLYVLVVTGANGCVGTNQIQFTLLSTVDLPNITGADFELLFNGVPLDAQDTITSCGGGGCLSGTLIPTWYVDGVPTELAQPYYVLYGTENGCGVQSSYANGAMDWDQVPEESGWYPLNVHLVMHVEGCSDDTLAFDVQDSVYINTGAAPVIQPIEDIQLCIGDTSMVVLDCVGCEEIEWSGTGGTYSVSTSMDTLLVWGFGLFSVIGGSASVTACETVEYFNVVQATPPPILVEPLAVCPGDTALIHTTYTSVSYAWSGPSGPLDVDDDSLYVTEFGSYYLVVQTAQGCELFGGPAILQQFATPSINIIPDNILCPGESAALEVVGGALENVVWDPPLSGNGLSQSVDAGGTYSCTVTACGNEFPLSAVIYESGISAAIDPGPFTLCGGGTALLDGPDGDYDFLWSPGGSTADDLLVSDAGDYFVQITDSLGCSATSNTATVTEQQFSQPLQVLGDSLCAGESTTLLASGSGVIQWFADPGLVQLITEGNTLNTGALFASDTVHVTQTEAGCTGPAQAVMIIVFPVPGPVSISGDTSLCAGEPLDLSVTGPAGADFVWTTPQGDASGGSYTIASITTDDEGTYTCHAEEHGCVGALDQVQVTVQAPGAAPVISGGTDLCEGDVLTLTVSGVEVNSFTWITPAGPVAGTALTYSTAVTSAATGVYTVIADDGECPDLSASVEVVVEDCDIVIPNVFSPNADGVNDYFVVEGSASMTLAFRVFNRWGKEVYYSSANSIAWDGRDENHDALSDGVYYYELHEIRTGKTTVRSGYLQLTRGK